MSASTIMSLIDENAHHLPDGVYLKLCNELKNLHQGSKNNRKALSFTDYNDQTQYVCCQSLAEFDEFIRWVEEAMSLDKEYLEWSETLKHWKKGGGDVPEKYFKPCVSRFMEMNYLETRGRSPHPDFTAHGLRAKGITIQGEDQAFYSEWFPQLGPWYTRMIDMTMRGGSADYQWREFSNTEGFESLLRLVQHGQRAIEWRRMWHDRCGESAFRETDASVTGGNINFHMNFVDPDIEPYDTDDEDI